MSYLTPEQDAYTDAVAGHLYDRDPAPECVECGRSGCRMYERRNGPWCGKCLEPVARENVYDALGEGVMWFAVSPALIEIWVRGENA